MREKELILKELNNTAEKLRILADELKDCAMSLDLAWTDPENEVGTRFCEHYKGKCMVEPSVLCHTMNNKDCCPIYRRSKEVSV